MTDPIDGWTVFLVTTVRTRVPIQGGVGGCKTYSFPDPTTLAVCKVSTLVDPDCDKGRPLVDDGEVQIDVS